MTPLETMAAAYTAHKHGRDVWPILSEGCRKDIMGNMRAALMALYGCELPEEARRRASPYRQGHGGEAIGEASFRAVVRQIVEEG